MNSNLTNGARGTFSNIVELNSDLTLTVGVRWLLTVKMKGVVFEGSFSRVPGSSGIAEFASLLGFIDEGLGICRDPRGLAIWIEGAGADVEVNPVTSFENLKVSQCSFGVKSVGCTKRGAGWLCGPFDQVVDGGESGCWQCEGHNNEGEENGNDEGEFHVG